jgi:hypothetical protein
MKRARARDVASTGAHAPDASRCATHGSFLHPRVAERGSERLSPPFCYAWVQIRRASRGRLSEPRRASAVDRSRSDAHRRATAQRVARQRPVRARAAVPQPSRDCAVPRRRDGRDQSAGARGGRDGALRHGAATHSASPSSSSTSAHSASRSITNPGHPGTSSILPLALLRAMTYRASSPRSKISIVRSCGSTIQ